MSPHCLFLWLCVVCALWSCEGAIELSSRALPYTAVRGSSYNVSYDNRAILINGERVILQSGSLHYPRTTPDQFHTLAQRFADNGLNTIQTYIFWNYHEAVEGQLDFTTEARNFTALLQAAQDVGLFVNLRIGPYVCAEWDYGGFPFWLREKNGMVFRTNNDPWKASMARFLTLILEISEPWLARNGGPVILAQVENEYGNIEGSYGAEGQVYVQWAAKLVNALDTGVEWIMCQQDDAPESVIQTCNGFYCDQWIAGHVQRQPTQPHMWTEDWTGWFQDWGEAKPTRPAEDIAFAVARWFELGGTFQNYYMFFGGTTFGRWGGGPFITTTYDYDAPLSEYGAPNEPKYSHLARLHYALQQFAPAILGENSIPQAQSLGPSQEGHVYGTIGQQGSVAFLANIDATNAYTVTFHSAQFVLPAWSVSIVDGATLSIVYNTAQVSTGMPLMPGPAMPSAVMTVEMTKGAKKAPAHSVKAEIAATGAGAATQIFSVSEQIGSSASSLKSSNPLELLSITKDVTDYLWYSVPIALSDAQIAKGSVSLSLNNCNDYFYTYIDGVMLTSGRSITSTTVFTLNVSSFHAGNHTLTLLVMTIGLQNYGPFLESITRGLQGDVILDSQRLTPAPAGTQWTHTPYVEGEYRGYFLPGSSAPWSSSYQPSIGKPLQWFRLVLQAPPSGSAVYGYALDLGSMGKGFAYVNGHNIGRYWNVVATASTCTPTCDYRGSYSPDKCRQGCNQPTQRYYHVPETWMRQAGTEVEVVLFEEQGGDPTKIQWKFY